MVDAELIDKIQTFITDELTRDGSERCDQLELIDGDSIARNPSPLRTWSGDALVRQFSGITAEIVDTAKAVATETGPGKHRFVVRARHLHGTCSSLSFTISSQKEEQTQPMDDPYRTSQPPEVKINGAIADNLLRHLEKLLSDDKLDNETRRRALAECYHTLRVAIWTAQGKTTGSVIETVMKETAKRLENASKETDEMSNALKEMYKEAGNLKETLVAHVARRNEIITQMATTIAAGIWSRGGKMDDQTINEVAELSRKQAEALLRLEKEPDVR